MGEGANYPIVGIGTRHDIRQQGSPDKSANFLTGSRKFDAQKAG